MVLVRHAIGRGAFTYVGGAVFAHLRYRVGERSALDVLDGAVFAASSRVREENREELVQSLAEATEKGAVRVQDWEAWRLAVEEHRPTMLMMLPCWRASSAAAACASNSGAR